MKKTSLTLEDALFVVEHWRLTAHHKAAAELLSAASVELRDECNRLERQVERLTPPRDSTHILGTDDANKLRQQGRDESAALIRELRAEIETLRAPKARKK